ncbi:hypothetical protein PVAP13_7NG130934 [Panicum virgatum]|uniref:Uncharacterized protein n=1 Tax=Panicum virgatum TaxID=38727 RepID=A0A8T0Q087_PANVG|nr:hypothetical protein PVAP13_7NG130934 [Panicum virgatum]
MAGAAFLRSVASKIARAPPRLLVQEGLQLHDLLPAGTRPALPSVPRSSNRMWSSSTSHASNSTPNNRLGAVAKFY